ncbi:MAG: hypothetical protein H7123_09535, partial [Thermoleophilia bacterium]|nr:hypothetical protein [Thermoleophilia bacterium]
MSDTPALHLVPPADDTAADSVAVDRIADAKLEALQAVAIIEQDTAGTSSASITTAHATPLTTNGPRFPLRVRGYDRSQVDARMLAEERQRVELETRLLERDHDISTTSKQLEGTRRELRYWHDRQAFIDSELDRAREESARLVAEATVRA